MEDDIIQGFIEESNEYITELDSEFVALEKSPKDKEIISSIFRKIHTIKGSSSFIGMAAIGKLTHSMESLLGLMRDKDFPVTTEGISLILEALDEVKKLFVGLKANGEEPALELDPIITRLEQYAETGVIPAGSGSSTVGSTAVECNDPQETESNAMTPELAALCGNMEAGGDIDFDSIDAAINAAAANYRASQQSANQEAEAAPKEEPQPAVPVAEKTPKPTPEKKSVKQKSSSKKKSTSDLSIRVNVDVLEQLMNLVGELVLTRNQLVQMARDEEESKYVAPITHLNRVTTDLQEGVMKTRMQPIGNAWSKMPRMVRDLSQLTGKQIELEMVGSETELDRTVLEAIKDPLTHMVRNSGDHGIESAAVRKENGKSENGTIRLNAYHEGGHVIICIEDDGAGIDASRIRIKALEKGLITEDEADTMSEKAIIQLVFAPGFSTAEQVSAVSGRGVGMDVVRTEIERIGGTVELISQLGKGTIVKIKIPLTLAIISALVVKCGGQTFAIPQLGVVELVRLEGDDRNRIEKIHDHQVFRLRDRLLPLVHLDDVMGIAEGEPDEESAINIVVIQVGEEHLGLVVSDVFDTEEIVVKPVGSLLKDIGIYQGTTILGDGSVIMILDVAGIASQFDTQTHNSGSVDSGADSAKHAERGTTSLLLFDAGDGTTKSVPLSLVARLEEFPESSIEKSGDSMVVQYRGSLLPLQPISQCGNGEVKTLQPVIVFSEGRQAMGLMVDEIKDVVSERLSISRQSSHPGILGTAIIDGNATDVIDTQHYLLQTNPEWFSQVDTGEPRSLLVVDPSVFFRQLITTAMETEGFYVMAATDSVEAIGLIDDGHHFDAVITDASVLAAGGSDLVSWIRSRPDSVASPIIALSSVHSAALEKECLEAGCDQFLKKFDVRELTMTIENLCGPKRQKGVSA